MFARLCVDMDEAGNAIGASVELHQEGELKTVWVGIPGPFDSPEEALTYARQWVDAHIGRQRSLF